MANPEHLAILKQGVEVWNKWRNVYPNSVPDLSDENLSGINLAGASLNWANLMFANLITADLSNAYLIRANLSGADLSRTNLRKAYMPVAEFVRANLSEADLSEASLQRVQFGQANLSRSCFGQAIMGWTVLGEVDLSTAEGLETVVHDGPSYISVDTIYRSSGNIPEKFLRNCGIPEDFISYSRTLFEKPKCFTCMISYSSKDEGFCKRFYSNLRAKYVQVWRFVEDAKLGEFVWKEIDSAIMNYDKVIPVCSKNSLQSPKVLREIDRALEREDHERNVFWFPLLSTIIFSMNGSTHVKWMCS